MSTSATVTLTLKSKPKIQPIQSEPRSPSTAVKLKLTKVNGQASSPAVSPAQTSSPVSLPTVAPPSTGAPLTSERKSPPKNGTGVTPKLVRKLSLSSSAQSTTKDVKDDPVAPPPRAKVLSRFPLKRNSFDRSSFGVELKRVDKSASVSKDTKKEEAKTNGDVSNTIPEQLQPGPEDSAAKVGNSSTPTTAVVNGTATEEDSTAVEVQVNGNPTPNAEPTNGCVVENGQAEAISEKDKENITAKVKDAGEESKKAVTKKTFLRKSVKKKSPPASECRSTAENGTVPGVPPAVIANGNPEPQTSVPTAFNASPTAPRLTKEVDEVSAATVNNNETTATSKAKAEVNEEVRPTPVPPSPSEVTSSSCSVTSEERAFDDIEEVSSSSTLTPAPSEERELLPTIITTATITTTTTSTTTANTTTTASSPAAPPLVENSPNVHIKNSASDSGSFSSVVVASEAAKSDAVPAAEVGSAGIGGTPADGGSSRPETLVQTPRLANHLNANVTTQRTLTMATPQEAATSAMDRSSAAGASPKDVIAAKPPKPETSSGTEKDSVMKNVKNATTLAIGKTLQKPLNLAQKVLEAALQVKSPNGSLPSQTTLIRNAQAMPSTSFSASHTGAVVPIMYAGGSLVERAQPFAPGCQSQPPSRPSSVMANIQTVDIRNLGQLLRSPTPRPLSVLDGVDPRETELKDAFTDTASSSGVSCSLSTHSLATTIAQSRSASPESLLSLSAAPSRHGSKKMEHYGLGCSQSQVEQQKCEALERKQSRLEADLKDAHYSLSRERAQTLQLQEELRQTRQERNDAQQRLDAAISDAIHKEKLALRLQRELSESGAHEDTAEIEVGILKRQHTQLEEVVSTQKEDLEDLQSQLRMLREQNKQLEDQIKKQTDRSTQDIKHKDRELDQLKTAAHNEVAHYQKLLKECQEQRRELLRKNSELQENRQELVEKVQEVGDQAATEKRLKRCLYRTLVLLRDARVTIEHMRATQPTRTQISKLRQKAEEADQLKEIAERAKESAVAQGEQLEQALEQVVQTRHFLQTRVDKLSHDNKQLQNQVDDLAIENTDLDERYKKQVSINSCEQETREEAANKIVKLEAQVETLESRLQQLRFERQVEEDSRVNSVLNSFETRTNQLELKLETEKLDKHKLQTQFNRLSDQLENCRRELDAAQKREASLQITTTNQQRCLLDMRRELAEARDRNCQMRMERQTLDSQLEEFIEEVRHLQTCLRVANQRIRDLEIALETTDPIQIENIMESIIEDSNSDDYEDADGGEMQAPP